MNEVEEALIESLENFIDSVRNGGINLESVDTSMVEPISMTMERNYFRKKLSIEYSEVPEKEYKTQQEIYKELYDKYAILLSKNCYYKGDANDTSIRCNRYAVENTQRVWKKQYEVH